MYGFNVLFALQPIVGVDGKSYALGRKQNWTYTNIEKARIQRRQLFYSEARTMLATLTGRYTDRKNICFADLSGIFKAVKETLYVDFSHLNSRGSEINASAIVKQLADCGFLSPRTAAN